MRLFPRYGPAIIGKHMLDPLFQGILRRRQESSALAMARLTDPSGLVLHVQHICNAETANVPASLVYVEVPPHHPMSLKQVHEQLTGKPLPKALKHQIKPARLPIQRVTDDPGQRERLQAFLSKSGLFSDAVLETLDHCVTAYATENTPETMAPTPTAGPAENAEIPTADARGEFVTRYHQRNNAARYK